MDTDRKPFKIDILKVKQKVYDLYPHNSPVRQKLIRTEKLKDLQELEISYSAFCDKGIKEIYNINKNKVFVDVCLFILSLTAVFALTNLVFLIHSLAIVSLLTILNCFSLYSSWKYFSTILRAVKTLRDFTRKKKDLAKQIEELKKDLEK